MTDKPTRTARVVERKNMTLREAADWYGLSERTLRRRIAEGKLRAYRVGPRSIRVSVEDLDALARPIPSAG